jgi:hypothetical protein
MSKVIHFFPGSFVGRLKIMGDLVNCLANAWVIGAHHIGRRSELRRQWQGSQLKGQTAQEAPCPFLQRDKSMTRHIGNWVDTDVPQAVSSFGSARERREWMMETKPGCRMSDRMRGGEARWLMPMRYY